MAKAVEGNIVVGLDIGSANIIALVGELLPDGQINIIGSGESPSNGMSKGGVNDLESVVKSIQRAVDQARLMSECDISDVYLSLSGEHIGSRIEKGMGAISEEEVSQDDIDAVIHTAKSIKIGEEQRVLHVIPQEFTIDYQEGIKNPIGLSGVRMEASVHLISCHTDMARNITKSVEKCGLNVEQLIYSGFASSNAVLTDDERELGVCVVDIGAGTMDVSIWTGGVLRYTKVFAYAGNKVTDDISYAFGTPFNDAEEIKTKFGCALTELVRPDEQVEVTGVGGRPSKLLQRQLLAEVIEPRYTELMGMVNGVIDSVQVNLRERGIKHQLAAGVVLTGGASQIEGLVECAERVFRVQVRVGEPRDVIGLTEYVKDPRHATAVGLLCYAKDNEFSDDDFHKHADKPKKKKPASDVSFTNYFKKLRNWIKKEF